MVLVNSEGKYAVLIRKAKGGYVLTTTDDKAKATVVNTAEIFDLIERFPNYHAEV